MPPANRTGDQFDTLVVVRHKPVLEDSLKPSRLCRVSGRNGGQFTEGLESGLHRSGSPDPSASSHSSVAPSTLEEALNPESAKDCVRYRDALSADSTTLNDD